MKIPDCYDADRMFDAMDMANTARLHRRPECVRCGRHIASDTYLDLFDLGACGYVCERCVEDCTYNIEDFED